MGSLNVVYFNLKWDGDLKCVSSLGRVARPLTRVVCSWLPPCSASPYSQESWCSRCYSTAGRYGRMCRQYRYELWKNQVSQFDSFVLNPTRVPSVLWFHRSGCSHQSHNSAVCCGDLKHSLFGQYEVARHPRREKGPLICLCSAATSCVWFHWLFQTMTWPAIFWKGMLLRSQRTSRWLGMCSKLPQEPGFRLAYCDGKSWAP